MVNLAFQAVLGKALKKPCEGIIKKTGGKRGNQRIKRGKPRRTFQSLLGRQEEPKYTANFNLSPQFNPKTIPIKLPILYTFKALASNATTHHVWWFSFCAGFIHDPFSIPVNSSFILLSAFLRGFSIIKNKKSEKFEFK